MNFKVTPYSITDAQLEYIRSLLERHKYKEYELINELNHKVGMKLKGRGLEDLTKQEASDVIEYLKHK